MKVFLVLLLACAMCMPSDIEEDEAIKPEDILKFFKGFLEGIGEKGGIEELKKCIDNAEGIIRDIIEAIKLIATKKFENIIMGVTKLVEAVKKLLDMIAPCAASLKELMKLIEKLKHIDIMKLAMKILGHLTEFIAYITTAIQCFQKEDLACAGLNIGKFLRVLFLDDSMEGDFVIPEFGFDDFVKILQGFLGGINQSGSLGSTLECVNHMPDIYKEFMDLIELIKNIHWSNIEELAEAIIKLGDAVKVILNSIIPCSKSPAEVIAIITKIGSITGELLLEHLLKHIGSLLADITAAIGHVQAAKWTEFGGDLGDVFYVLLLADSE